jgi:hypothetical protein
VAVCHRCAGSFARHFLTARDRRRRDCLRQGRRVGLDDAGGERGRRFRYEGPRTRQHLVEHGAQREQIRSRIDRASQLLRCHVRQGALPAALADRRGERDVRVLAGAPQPGDPEVEELYTRRRQHDVPRLYVLVNHTVLVRERKAVCGRGGNRQALR